MKEDKKKFDSGSIEIVDYENVVKESEVHKFEHFFEDIDHFRTECLETIVPILKSYGEGAIGRAIVLSVLHKLKTRLKKKITLAESEIPDIASVKFVLYGTLKDGRKILVSKDFDRTTEIGVQRDKSIELYGKQMNTYVSLSLNNLLADIEDTIYQIEVLETYPDVTDWYPTPVSESTDSLDGTAKACIGRFISDKNVDPRHKAGAQAFLTTYEIIANETSFKGVNKSRSQTVKDILNHSSFPNDVTIPKSNRRLREWLNIYWDDYRGTDKLS